MRFLSVLALLALFSAPAAAQDALTAAPDVYKRVFENEKMRVLEANIKPKTKADWHSHPEHLLYMLTEGTLVFQSQNKKPYEMTFAAGQTLLLPAQMTATENDSDKPVRFLVLELKGARAAAPVARAVAPAPAARAATAPAARPAAAKAGRTVAGKSNARASRASSRPRFKRRR